VEILLTDYVQVRRHRDQFILVPGREQPEIGRVVERRPDYVIVEKEGVAAEAADPES
jgi:hypothetical protein